MIIAISLDIKLERGMKEVFTKKINKSERETNNPLLMYWGEKPLNTHQKASVLGPPTVGTC